MMFEIEAANARQLAAAVVGPPDRFHERLADGIAVLDAEQIALDIEAAADPVKRAGLAAQKHARALELGNTDVMLAGFAATMHAGGWDQWKFLAFFADVFENSNEYYASVLNLSRHGLWPWDRDAHTQGGSDEQNADTPGPSDP